MSIASSQSPSPPSSLRQDSPSPAPENEHVLPSTTQSVLGPVKAETANYEVVGKTELLASPPLKTESLPEKASTKMKEKSMGFSIQSILSRPEPIRPVPEHATFSYPHLLHYPNLAAFFPHKMVSSAMHLGHLPQIYGSCWQPQISRNDSPENLSTKPSFSTIRGTPKQDTPGSGGSEYQAKREEKNASCTPSSHLITSAMAGRKTIITSASNVNIAAVRGMSSDNFNPEENSRSSPSPFSTDGDGDGDGAGNDNANEDGKSPPSSPSGSNSHRRKKTRTVFSRSQVFQLESTFDLKRYLSSADRAALAASLNLSEQQIKIWFQNRRNKWKRQISSDSDSALISAGQMHAAAAAGRFGPGHPAFPMSLYSFQGNMHQVSGGESSGGGNPTGLSNLFCQGPMHPLYMASHLPFPRPSV